MMPASDTSLRVLSGTGYPPVPPQKPPTGNVVSVVKSEWGSASIYDNEIGGPKDQATEKPVKPSIEKLRPIRRSKFSMINQASLKEFAETGQMDEEILYWYLPFLQASMLATIAEDVIIEMRILVECNTALRVMKTLTDMELLVALKFGVKQRPKKDELDGINPRKLRCSEYKLVKMDTDRNKVLNLILTLYVELSTSNSFGALIDFVSLVQEYDEHKAFIIEDEAKNYSLKKELYKKIRLQVNHIKTVKYEADNILVSLKSQIEDATLMTETKGRYTDNWQAARTEQHELVLGEKESIYTDSMEYFKTRFDHESRVHAEVEAFTNILINENLQAVSELMDKYETDMEKIDLRIQIQKIEWQNALDKRREMEKTYRLHSKAIIDWIHFKDEREKAQLYSRTMTKSAIIVQAWWRGLLVRKQLGPYRPKKGKKAKKK